MMGRGDAPRVPGLIITGEHAELDIVQGELVVRHRRAGRRARVSLRSGNGSGVRRKIWDGRERRGDGRGGDGGHEPANPVRCWSFRNLAAFAAVSPDFEPRYDHVSRPSSGFRSGAARGDIRRLGLPKSEILPGERTRAVGTRRGRDCIGVSASANAFGRVSGG